MPGCRRWPRASSARPRRSPRSSPVKDGTKTPGKVAIFSTCYINYNEPGIGHGPAQGAGPQRSAVRAGEQGEVLRHAQAGAGRPGLGRTPARKPTSRCWRSTRSEGYAILSAVPSCTLMFKQEIPLMYPDDADVQAVKEAMWDPFEYLDGAPARRPAQDRVQPAAGQGELPRALPLRACRTSASKTEEMLKMVPGTFVQTNERCSGHAGTFGVKKPYHEIAMKIGKPLFKRMAEHPAGRHARLHQLRLPAGRPPHRPGVRPQLAGHAQAGAPAHAGAHGVRPEVGCHACRSMRPGGCANPA